MKGRKEREKGLSGMMEERHLSVSGSTHGREREERTQMDLGERGGSANGKGKQDYTEVRNHTSKGVFLSINKPKKTVYIFQTCSICVSAKCTQPPPGDIFNSRGSIRSK